MAIKSKRIGEQVDRNTLGRIRVLNNSGTAISKGDILSVSGATASGGNLTVVIADANALDIAAFGMKLVADHDIADGSTGIAVDWKISDVDTTAWANPPAAAGDPVFLSDAGTTGNTLDGVPSLGAYQLQIGQVIVAGANGRVLLHPIKWLVV